MFFEGRLFFFVICFFFEKLLLSYLVFFAPVAFTVGSRGWPAVFFLLGEGPGFRRNVCLGPLARVFFPGHPRFGFGTLFFFVNLTDEQFAGRRFQFARVNSFYLVKPTVFSF